MTIDQAFATKIENETNIQKLTTSFADAVNRRDLELFKSLWSIRGIWAIEPPFSMEVTGVDEIAAAFTRLLNNWEFFIQIVHQGSISLNGDLATARWYMNEIGRDFDGKGFQNYGVYLDELINQDNQWLFTKRTYRYIYIDRPSFPGQSFLIK
jgi:ketosteroid isomerase-like protein